MMLCDGLTKQMSKANLNSLQAAMKSGRYVTREARDEKSHRQELKKKGVSIKRPKGRNVEMIDPADRGGDLTHARCVSSGQGQAR